MLSRGQGRQQIGEPSAVHFIRAALASPEAAEGQEHLVQFLHHRRRELYPAHDWV